MYKRSFINFLSDGFAVIKYLLIVWSISFNILSFSVTIFLSGNCSEENCSEESGPPDSTTLYAAIIVVVLLIVFVVIFVIGFQCVRQIIHHHKELKEEADDE